MSDTGAFLGTGGVSDPPSDAPAAVSRIRKAHEQIADQIREMILQGELVPGQRLPNEGQMASNFGVSRPTLREALRALAAQNLIVTTKGASGGSYIARPSVAQITDSLVSSMTVLSRSADITLDEFLEARAILEIPTARLAAAHRDADHIAQLAACIPDHPLQLPVDHQFAFNKDFHAVLVATSGNPLLTICAAPIFTVLQTNLRRTQLGTDFHERINADHRGILEAIERGDEDDTERQMLAHLEYLKPRYALAWQATGHPHGGADAGPTNHDHLG